MIEQIKEEYRKKILLDGSHLKKTRSAGGIGAGLIAFGLCLMAAALMLAAALASIDMVMGGVAIVGIAAVVCIPAILGGKVLYQRRISSYKRYYVKHSGYSEEELDDFDREARTNDMVLLFPGKRLNKQAFREMGFVTDHWLKAPGLLSKFMKLNDIAAMWYEKRGFYKNNELNPSVFIIGSTGKFCNITADEKLGREIIDEATKRNPLIIKTRRFTYEGREYDALSQEEEVAAIYRKEFEKAMNSR